MRTIKFRVWEHHNNKFTNNPIGFGLNNNFELSIPNDSFDGEIWKFTYQQYTGLKDKNEKDLYEGDIVEWVGKFIAEVSWCEENAAFQIKSKDGGAFLSYLYMQNFQIIGNIYENPELLK